MFDLLKNNIPSIIDEAVTISDRNLEGLSSFLPVAKGLHISRVVRTLEYMGQTSCTTIYTDSSVFPVYNRVFKRRNDLCTYTYEYFTENEIDLNDPQTKEAYESLTSLLSLICTCSLNIHAEKMLSRLDRDSGIPNVKGFRAFFEKAKQSGSLTDYVVVRANIKGCNILNNIFGYQATTDIILKYANELNRLMRTDELCSRSGSDNFCLMVKKERIKLHLKNFAKLPVHFSYGKEKAMYEISLRAGVVSIEGDTDDPDEILACAETCLDISKRRVDEDIVFYDEQTVIREQELTLLEKQMPDALENNEFVVCFQPKVCVDTRTLVGAEALVRWKKDGRLISPMDFIPIAERTGFIRKIDMYVLDYTCKMIRKWIDEGKRVVPVSVNFSKIHLRFSHLADKIMRVVEEYGIAPSLIEIEFTETAYTDDFNAIKETLSDLKRYGVLVSMDDFGTGYSSLALLKDLEFDVLKLDKSLSESNKDERGLVVLENVLHMAKELSMTTICEGVEEKEIVERLGGMGCNIIQGYYFDRPLPETDFSSRLEAPKYDR